MRKIVTVATVVAVLGVGIGVIGYSLIRTSGQIGRVGVEMPAPLDAAARGQEPRTTDPRSAPVAFAAPAADAVAEVSGEPRADELTADERSPFGHAGNEQIQPDHETTIAEGPPADAGDATSLAPLLADAHVTLTQLLADAEGDPDAKAELAALLGSSSPLEALLDDPDPAVREEAAKLLQVLASSTAQ